MSGNRPAPVRLFVTDLDNTLFDWFAAWHASFSAMTDELVRISGLPRAQLLDEMRVIHQQRGTSEYSYVIQELPSLQGYGDAVEIAHHFEPAISAYREARNASLRLYPGTRETLEAIRGSGTLIVAYTESLAYYASYRLRKLGLDSLIDFLYSPADHDFPAGVDPSDLRTRDARHYEMKLTRQRFTPSGHFKPEPVVLETIMSEFGATPAETLYVGDSLMKDIAMAQAAGALDAHAAYGVAQHLDGYDLLRSVTHWNDEDVERERAIAAAPHVTPSLVLGSGLADLLPHFRFEATT
jgi:phosphoglycolate phosphatase